MVYQFEGNYYKIKIKTCRERLKINYREISYVCVCVCVFDLVSLFNGISNFVGYLMLKLSL